MRPDNIIHYFCAVLLSMAFNRTYVLLACSLVQKCKEFTYALKDEHIEVLLNNANGEHTLAVLPTGFGKSYLFILAPLIMDVLDQDKLHYSLVIVPLISLMSDIKEKFELKGVEVGPIYCLYTTLFLFCMNEIIQSEKIANL